MANTFITPTMIARRLSLILATSLGFGASISRRYDDRFANKGAQIGDEYSIKIPPRPLVTDAVDMPTTPQDFKETRRTMKVDYRHVAANITDAELQMHIDSFAEQVLEPAAAALAANIDREGTKMYRAVPNIVGGGGDNGAIGGGAPTDLSTYLLAGAKLTEEGAPSTRMAPHKLCINAEMNRQIVNALKGLHEDSSSIASQYLNAAMRRVAGFDWLYDQQMYLHTCGTRAKETAGDAALNGVPSEGDTTIAIDSLNGATQTVKAGDVLTIANCYAVDPQSGQSTGRLRQFVATADAVGISSAIAALAIYPAIRADFPDKTVSVLPADNANIEFYGAASAVGHQGLAYHRDAFALAVVDAMLPKGVDFAAQTSAIDAQEWKVSMHIIRQYTVGKHSYPTRIGCYFSWLAARPELAVRITT